MAKFRKSKKDEEVNSIIEDNEVIIEEPKKEDPEVEDQKIEQPIVERKVETKAKIESLADFLF